MPFEGSEPRRGVRIRGLRREYVSARDRLEILRGVDLDLEPGTSAAIVGKSGAGKSTLLHLLGLLDRPSGGSLEIDGIDVVVAPRPVRNRLRLEHIGFVFQFYHLLEELTAEQNVLLAGMMHQSPLRWWRRRKEERERARALLERVGLSDRLRHTPSKLSGGERQRVAIARALFCQPEFLLCDEPTGNLDERTSDQIENLLLELAAEHPDMILVLVTHNLRLAHRLNRVLLLEAGRLRDVSNEEGWGGPAGDSLAASTL